jgi:L-ascorbate metabolism protein UlaG (beta-lactamase superfamily)
MGSTEFGGVEIAWFGHASFMLACDAGAVYVDPYLLPSAPAKADVVVMTHEHADHCAAENAGRLMKDSTVVVTTPACARRCPGDVRSAKPGDVVEVGEIKVEAVEAYNRAKPFHPRGLGFGAVIEMQGVRVYHAGDTDFIPEMAELEVDVALLPIGGYYTMDEREAAEAALAIKPKLAIPMHYNHIPQTEADPQLFRRLIEEKDRSIEVRIL